MKKVYFLNLEFPKLFKGEGRYVATSKAREDIEQILRQQFDVIYCPVYRKYTNKILGSLEVLFNLIKVCYNIPKQEAIFIQYPILNHSVFRLVNSLWKKYNVIALIHDIQSYRHVDRYTKSDRKKEIAILNSFKTIIVHTPAMSEFLRKEGVKSSMIVLNAFDYILDVEQTCKKENYSIVFAGALQKSVFLERINEVPFSIININLYGAKKPMIEESEHVRYMGCFAPNDVQNIKGEWGLLWDGESIDTCDGKIGNYLKIIAPHKFSLYVACGLKIIVWEKSAMAPLVIEKGIGIVISSLFEIEDKIKKISEEELIRMQKNVDDMSVALKKGEMFKGALNKIICKY